jgi:hypothetical protein
LALPHIQDADEGCTSTLSDRELEPYYVYFQESVCRLRPANTVPFPEGRFEVTAHTYSSDYLKFPRGSLLPMFACLSPRNILNKDKSYERAFAQAGASHQMPFDEQMCFLKNNQVWTRLTLLEATRLWGRPCKHDDYYTFGARNFHHG